ncbi:hypothetical protein EVAR_86617_1 [Eumeta japonica]|uniref:Uncharacterized protein n=1 Tax=Eumeta variegata TaxID=151549 RepID=A0A4C1W152_EUMVA|nr:hypothetical protein EVAR_86617_1 [Eumeta japonica]
MTLTPSYRYCIKDFIRPTPRTTPGEPRALCNAPSLVYDHSAYQNEDFFRKPSLIKPLQARDECLNYNYKWEGDWDRQQVKGHVFYAHAGEAVSGKLVYYNESILYLQRSLAKRNEVTVELPLGVASNVFHPVADPSTDNIYLPPSTMSGFFTSVDSPRDIA